MYTMEFYLELFKENYILMVLTLTFIMFLPIPTTPALVYVMISFGPLITLIVYLSASTVNSALIYSIGKIITRVNFIKRCLRCVKLYLLSKTSFIAIQKFIFRSKKSTQYATKILAKSTILDIAMVRFYGLHNHIIMFTLGLLSIRPINAFIVNTVFACIDVAFYWMILGPGLTLLQRFFPNFDIADILENYDISVNIFLLTIIFYVLYIAYRIVKRKRTVSEKDARL